MLSEGLQNQGVKKSVYLPVNQMLNPLFFLPLTLPTSVCSFISSSFTAFFFAFLSRRIELSIMWSVAGAFLFHYTAGVCHHSEW